MAKEPNKAPAIEEVEVEQPAADDIVAQLAQLGAELQAVANDETARTATLRKVEETLGNLKVKDFPDLAESPVIQKFVEMFGDTSGMRPGETRNKGTLAEVNRDWKWSDLKIFPLVKWFPSKDITLTFNGLSLRVLGNKECETPSCFYDIYKEHMQALEQAAINEQYLLGRSNTPPHPNWQSPEAAVVRAYSTQGAHLGLVSGFIGVGPLNTEVPEAPKE